MVISYIQLMVHNKIVWLLSGDNLYQEKIYKTGQTCLDS